MVDVIVFIIFDEFPLETSWAIFLSNITEAPVASKPPGFYGILTDGNASEVVSLMEGEDYVFVIEDTVGDGLCCNTPGSYKVFQGNNELFSGNFTNGSSESTTFTTLISTPMPALAPTSTPTPVPTGTPRPTQSPTLHPSSAPTEAPVTVAPVPSISPIVTAPIVEVSVFISFDSFPREIGWSISRVDIQGMVKFVPIGHYSPLDKNVTEVVQLIPGADYVFVIEDDFGDGLCCPNVGSYLVSQGSTELVSGGGNFGKEEITSFTTLI
jgi:hypothetical protein